MLSFLSAQRSAAYVARQAFRVAQGSRAIGSTAIRYAEAGQAEVVLVGCGAPNRGMESLTHGRVQVVEDLHLLF
jgi:hypothetical protein